MAQEIRIVSKVVARRRDGEYAPGSSMVITQVGGGGESENAEHANSAYTLDNDTPVRNWFISALDNDTAEGLIDFLQGIKIAGDIVNRIVNKDDANVTYTDEDMMSALRVMKEIEANAEKLNEIYLRKDKDDETRFLLRLLGGTQIGKWAKFGEFITGMSGGYIDDNGDAELNSLSLRDHLSVPEYRFNRMTYFEGYNVISPGGGFTIREVVDNGNNTYTIAPEYEEGEPCGLFVDDIYTGYWHNVGDTENSGIKGFGRIQYRVTSVNYESKTAVIAPNPDIHVAPQTNMKLGQTGNFTNTERQTYIIIDTRDGNCCITFFDHANTWDPEPAQMPAWFGKKKGMTVNGIDCDNYSAVLQNVIMTGVVFQVDEKTGSSIRVPIDKGEWIDGIYGYYNRVSHNGSLWLCIAENGTAEEPSDSSAAWLKQVSGGKDGVSITGGGHWESKNTPYKANVMVTLANSVFVSLVDTSNPPILISRINSGAFRRKKDGGYILAGAPTDWSVHPDWQILIDGRELKGESITFLGEFAEAPSNPSEGNSYYNTADGCTYIYRKGTWMVMTKDGTDGKDGDNYEWIYQRGNIIGNPPSKPDSQQEDEYIPEGWTDDPTGVDEDNQLEWACKRRKNNGIWGEWSDPAVAYRWGKDGEQGIPGKDGVGINSIGHWESSKAPVAKNTMVTFAGGTYLALEETLLPPISIAKFNLAAFRRKRDGGYILMGKSADKTINAGWQLMAEGAVNAASYWIDSSVGVINFTSTGSPSPSAFVATLKRSYEGSVEDYAGLYLAARKYNGSWLAHVSATRSESITVPATAGYTQFAIRAYTSESDANAWNNNFVAEKGVGVATDGVTGSQGEPGPFPRDRGVFGSDVSELGNYVWNDDNRDKILYMFNGIYYNFLVAAKGLSLTSSQPPTSPNGDSKWEAMSKFRNIATDTLFADGAKIGAFTYNNYAMQSEDKTNGVANLIMNSKTGYFHCINADISGKVNAKEGYIGAFSIDGYGLKNVADSPLANIVIQNTELSKYFVVNASSGKMCAIRSDRSIALEVIADGSAATGIYVRSTGDLTTHALSSYGNAELYAREGESILTKGHRVGYKIITLSYTIKSDDDFIVCNNSSNITVTLPNNDSIPEGKIIYIKKKSSGTVTLSGTIRTANSTTAVTTYDIGNNSHMLIYEGQLYGGAWTHFYCG